MTILTFPAAAPARDGATDVLGNLKRRHDKFHFAYVGHIELDCCWNGRLCETGRWLQSEADALGRRMAMAEGREVMW